MPLYTVNRVRRSPPQNPPIKVKWADPITRGLVVCAVPVGPRFYEAVTRQFSGAPGTVGVRPAIDGNRAVSRRIINPGTSSKLANPTGADTIVGAYSIFAECSPEVDAIGHQPIFASTEPSNGNGLIVGTDDATVQFNSMRIAHLYNLGGGTAASSGQLLLADSERYTHRIMWTWDTSSYRFYAKRVLGTTVGSMTTAPTADSARRCYFLTSVAGITGQAAASLVLVWNRVLSLEEYQRLHDNPWQVLALTPRKVWAPAGAAAASTIKTRRTSNSIGARMGSRSL